MVAFNQHIRRISEGNGSLRNNVPVGVVSALLLSIAVLTGCQSTVSEPGSMMKAAQSPPNPEAAARARTAMAAEYIKSGDLDAAQRSLAIALKTEPRLPEANNMMGVLLQQEGSEPNQIKAEEYFKKAIALKDDFAQARNNYGVFLSSRKRYAEAYTQFELAGSQLGYTERYAALENLGLTAEVLGKPAEAQQAFTQALQANRNSLVARFELAQIFLGQNRVQAARSLYDEYLQLLGGQPQSARSLWLGMRIAHQTQDMGRLQSLAERLQLSYPNSPEYQHYNELLKTGAAWD
ncbi:type IV pilus biogenesis/stability protein PilW [Aquirhabdus parva]|uniref:type IV pilus biogenesis/stability protein PilW n=1 Tax=Aquirhabdus parva TaxID=2283318 RepID=UPI001D18C87F|nr:type IV pilus biogenesis/stability protein PilW [Aquirhabdus parva]